MIKIKPTTLSRMVRALPNFLWPLKFYIVKHSLKKVGTNFRFGINCVFSDHRLIEIGDNVFIGDKSTLTTVVPMFIGNDVMFGPEVMILSGDHNISVAGKPMSAVHTGGINLTVTIENDVWIGSRATIMKGVTLGEGSVIGAASLVTKSLPPYSINIGTPCRTIKCRFSKKDLEFHLKAVGSKYTLEEIEKQYEKLNLKLS